MCTLCMDVSDTAFQRSGIVAKCCVFADLGFRECYVVLICAGKLCIEVAPADKIAYISEELCIGCGICAKVCSEQFVLFLFL